MVRNSPALFCLFPALISAPVVLFMVVKYWNKAETLTGSVRKGLVFAGILALLEILFFIGWLVYALSDIQGSGAV